MINRLRRTRGQQGVAAPIAIALIATALTFLIAPAHGQTYPNRPIKIIAPFPPGNAADVASRAMIDRLSQRLGQPVVVDNRSGGAGIIGVEAAVRSPADGYTLLVTSISPVAILPGVYKKLPYDAEKDLTPISMVGFTSMILVAGNNIAANSLQEMIALLKASPGKHNYAHIGGGTISHLIMESLKAATGIDVVGIPYKGSAQALTDMMGGQLTLMFDGMTSANIQVKAGKVKALAVTSHKRSPFAATVPTMGEGGVQALHDLNMIAWIGMFAPAGTPRAVIERWNTELNEVTKLPDVIERLGNVSIEPSPSATPEAFGEFHRNELVKWAGIAKTAGVFQSQ
ncbi:MAG: Bug family tripartite tricarboxylate transporter substrate binding protein [Burkholderiales bacterium]